MLSLPWVLPVRASGMQLNDLIQIFLNNDPCLTGTQPNSTRTTCLSSGTSRCSHSWRRAPCACCEGHMLPTHVNTITKPPGRHRSSTCLTQPAQ